MSHPLLLDEMLSAGIAASLRSRGHDVLAVVADPSLVALPDEEILAWATAAGRAVVTANIQDFAPLDGQYRAAGRSHAGLVFASMKTFPQDRSFTGAVVDAVHALLTEPDGIGPDRVVFLRRCPPGSVPRKRRRR